MTKRLLIGFFVGWTTYIIVWLGKDFHGGIEVFIQPLMAVFFSCIFVSIAFVSGIPLRATLLKKAWRRFRFVSLLLPITGIICILVPEQLGFTYEVIHPETEENFQAINPLIGAVCFYFAVFPFVNWPESEDPKNTKQRH